MLAYKVNLKQTGNILSHPFPAAAPGRRLLRGLAPITALLLVMAAGLILAPGAQAGPRPGGSPIWLDSPGGTQANQVVVGGAG
jgi:hypothetical protein